MLAIAMTIMPHTLPAAEAASAVAFPADEITAAATRLVEHKVLQGDENGNLNLDTGLSRVEFAVILTRLDIANDYAFKLGDETSIISPYGQAFGSRFKDVPEWAIAYTSFCFANRYMSGVSQTEFNPYGKVSAKQACTVILRFLKEEETDWSYDTAIPKAASLGFVPNGYKDGEITRGSVAALIIRAIHYAETKLNRIVFPPADPWLPPTPTPAPKKEKELKWYEREYTAEEIEQMKNDFIAETNRIRVEAGVPELIVLPELMDCAQAKAQDMVDNEYFDHVSPTYGSVDNMIKMFVPSVNGGGENIHEMAYSGKAAASVFAGSTPHLKNMTNKSSTHIGVGIGRRSYGGFVWVQQFVNLR
jgi:uncharacterized protein YkwD